MSTKGLWSGGPGAGKPIFIECLLCVRYCATCIENKISLFISLAKTQ